MRFLFSIGVMFIFVLIAVGCSSNDNATNEDPADTSASQPTTAPETEQTDDEVNANTDAETDVQEDTSSDLIVPESLDDLVSSADVIVVTAGAQPTDVINMARNEGNPEEPDEHVFVLGQVYDVAVDEYLKGDRDSTLQVVQREGFVYDHDEPVSQTYSDDEADSIRQESLDNTEHLPVSDEVTYVMFLRDLGGFADELGYLTGTHGAPWRFELTENGTMVPESQSEEANEYIGTLELNELATFIEEGAS